MFASSSPVDVARYMQLSATTSRPRGRGTEHDTTARDAADDARTVLDEQVIGQKVGDVDSPRPIAVLLVCVGQRR